jgi:predicted ester cyclase
MAIAEATTQTTRVAADRAMMEAYIHEVIERGPFARHFTADVTFRVEGSDLAAAGAAQVEQTIRLMHQELFDAHPVLKSLLVDGYRAAIEAEFIGTHTGEFAGIPATGRHVSVPYSVVYDLRGGKIAALRIYMPMNALVAQLTAPESATATAN